MATLARLQARSTFLAHQYYFRNSAVDVFRKKEYDAAVKIQSWFRGCRIRAYLRYLHRVATVIQKCWRGYLGRQHYQLIVKLEFCTMKMNLYNAMAVRLRDDLTHNLGGPNRSKNNVLEGSLAITPQLPRGAEGPPTVSWVAVMVQTVVMNYSTVPRMTLARGSHVMKTLLCSNRHYDVFSTSITPFDVGRILFLEDRDWLFSVDNKFLILSLGCATEFAMGGLILEQPGVWEGLLARAQVSCDSAVKLSVIQELSWGRSSVTRASTIPAVALASLGFLPNGLPCRAADNMGIGREALEEFAEMKEREEKKADLEREEKKRDYQARKMHYLLSTKQALWYSRKSMGIDISLQTLLLRVRYTLVLGDKLLKNTAHDLHSTLSTMLEKWFLPFSSYHKNKKYIPLMHSSSKYGPNSYGSQHFRDENPKKWICDKDFQTVLPSFDLFSKYGKLYSKAGQII
uniref:spermatogenesis-associated protein 17 n=1 Tax=Panthera onca TaxID=9690 RepID=UPI00295333DD|nr:spermatogenesis-associated protein 17 [Panthera onca]